MFAGHYAIGFFSKRKFHQIPLWLLFLAVQFVDVLAFLLVLLGVERIEYDPSENPFLRTNVEFVPFSHSLSSNVMIALVVFLVFWRLKDKTWGIVLGLAVLSHWFIDALVHVADMPLLHDSLKVGLGLWQVSWAAFLLEMLLLLSAAYYFFRRWKMGRSLVLIVLLIAASVSMFVAPEAEATPVQASLVSLSLYALFTGLAYWTDRRLGTLGTGDISR
jgi:hypothetical protein